MITFGRNEQGDMRMYMLYWNLPHRLEWIHGNNSLPPLVDAAHERTMRALHGSKSSFP